MGMYTALEVDLKLKWDDDLAATLARGLFDPSTFDLMEEDDWDTHGFSGRQWLYRLHRLFCLDGGISFGSAMRRLQVASEPCSGCDKHYKGCEKGFLLLYVRSSTKGMPDDLIRWLKPHAVGGFVRYRYEAWDSDHIERLGDALPISEGEGELQATVEEIRKHAAGPETFSSYADEKFADGIEHALTILRGKK